MNNVTEVNATTFNLNYLEMPQLYDGVQVETEPRVNIITTEQQKTANAIIKNAKKIIDESGPLGTVIVTGLVPGWVLQIFSLEVKNRCKKLMYDDGKGLLITVQTNG